MAVSALDSVGMPVVYEDSDGVEHQGIVRAVEVRRDKNGFVSIHLDVIVQYFRPDLLQIQVTIRRDIDDVGF